MTPASPQAILAATAAAFQLEVADLLGPRRFMPIIRARNAAVWALRQTAKAKGEQRTFSDIARIFGRADHSVFIHSFNRAEDLRARDPRYAARLDSLVEGHLAPPTDDPYEPAPPERPSDRHARIIAARVAKPRNALADDDHDAIRRLAGTLALGDALRAALEARG